MNNLCALFVFLLFVLPTHASKKTKSYFETSIFSVGEKLYPRFIIEDQSNFTPTSTMGLWALVEYSNVPYIPPRWINNGYYINSYYSLDTKIGILYDLPFNSLFVKFIIGVDYISNKKAFGPLIGLEFKTKKFYFSAFAVDSWKTAYEPKKYSQEYIDYYKVIGWGYPSCMNGFDPNSWYRIKLLYSLSNHVDLGIISERFYGTCLSSEYKLNKILKFKFMLGYDFEFNNNVFCFGLLSDIHN